MKLSKSECLISIFNNKVKTTVFLIYNFILGAYARDHVQKNTH